MLVRGQHRWKCGVLPVTGRGNKVAGLLKVKLCVTTNYPVSIWTYTFLVPEYALSFACTSPGNPHSGTVWDL